MATSDVNAESCAFVRLSFDPLAVPLKQLESGVVRVAGTRVSLDSVIYCYRQGDSPEAIAEAFPVLKVNDVRAVIAYYVAHRDEVDAWLRKEEETYEALRRENEKGWDAAGYKKKLLERREALTRQRDAASQ